MPFIFKGKQERDIECSLETNPFFCKKHYLYRHIRLDKNIPFYIGVGSHSRRQLYKRAFDYTLSGRRSAKWYDIFNKSPVTVDIIFESNNRDEIFEKEKEFISLYGREVDGGILVNNSLGGDGIGGAKLNLSTEARKRISARSFSKRGENHPSAKLTEFQIIRAIIMHNSGLNWGEIKLKIPGLSKAMLSRIRKGKAWKHLHHLVSSSVPEIRLGRILSQRDEVSVDIVCSLYKNGMAKYKIEKELKLDKGTISRILKMHGVNNWTKKQRVSILGQIQPNQFTNKK